MRYLNNNRIIYRKYSEDTPTKEYEWGWYYEEGTYGYYSLFNSDAKITTLRSLKWHLLTLWWLNPEMERNQFNTLADVICCKENEFVTFPVSYNLLKKVKEDIFMQDLDRSPNNKLRKIVFKDFCGLDKSQKLSIVGKLIGRKITITEEAIYQCMLDLNEKNTKITINKLATLLKCSTRTIHRNMSSQLKREKTFLNIENEKI